MTAILQQLGIERMTVGERIALVQLILDSVAAEQPPAPISGELGAELDRRAADADANPGAGIPWEVVKAEALARFER